MCAWRANRLLRPDQAGPPRSSGWSDRATATRSSSASTDDSSSANTPWRYVRTRRRTTRLASSSVVITSPAATQRSRAEGAGSSAVSCTRELPAPAALAHRPGQHGPQLRAGTLGGEHRDVRRVGARARVRHEHGEGQHSRQVGEPELAWQVSDESSLLSRGRGELARSEGLVEPDEGCGDGAEGAPAGERRHAEQRASLGIDAQLVFFCAEPRFPQRVSRGRGRRRASPDEVGVTAGQPGAAGIDRLELHRELASGEQHRRWPEDDPQRARGGAAGGRAE